MLKSLKSKLILGISVFIILLLTMASFMQVREKEKELTNDILIRARGFAELTADKLVNDYKLYLIPNSFIYFNREVQDTLAKNEDIAWVQVVSFDGKILYDSQQDREQKYQKEDRLIDKAGLIEQVKSKNLSAKVSGGEGVVFFKKETWPDGQITFQTVDVNEKPAVALSTDQRIDYLVQPADNEYSVVYGITYQALAAKVQATQFRIMLLAVFGVALGILLAIVFGSTITRPLAILKRGAEILATGDFSHRVVVKTRDEIYQLAQTFNKMAADLQESTKALVYKERVGKELELAKQIQQRIIPKIIPQVKGLDISAGVIPAEEIGGDCYDFLLPNDNELLFYLGDVTGHGVPAGIIVTIANALFYSYADRGLVLDEILTEVNEVLKAKSLPNMFVTLVLMKWMIKEAKFSYVSAGHEQIIHYVAKEDKVELLPSGGLALGMVKDISKLLKVQNVKLAKGDVLFIYSDGIPEAWKNEKESYGMDKLKETVKKYSKFPSALAIKNALMSDVYLYRQGYKQMDDITCVVVKRTV
jgi:serine phosphatase RsbU (regulator of sigma subunit)